MSSFESKEVEVGTDPDTLRDFLSNAENLYELLPKERIEDWEANEKSCSFRVSGVTSLDLHRTDEDENGTVNYHSGEKAPFPFRLTVRIEEKNEGSNCKVLCEAELNPILENMVKGPLERLFDHMAERINELDPGN